MTKARIQRFCRANNIIKGYSDGTRVFPRTVTGRNNALFLYNNHFCLKWKTEGVSVNQAIKEFKDNFNIVVNYITEKNVNSLFKYEFIPKKLESLLTNFIVHDLETHNIDRAGPYCISFYRLKKVSRRYGRDQTREELDKCKKDTIVLDGDNCISNALDFCLKLKGDERKVKNEVVEYNLQLHADNGGGSDTWVVLNNFPCDKQNVDIFKNGKGIFSLRVSNGYIYKGKKQIPQYLIFRCGMTHLNYSIKKLGKTFKKQKELLKTEKNLDEVYSDTWKDKKHEWLNCVKNDVSCFSFCYARYSKAMEEITGYSMKDCCHYQVLVGNFLIV